MELLKTIETATYSNNTTEDLVFHDTHKVRLFLLFLWCFFTLLYRINTIQTNLVGGFNPSEKYYSSQMGLLFPMHGK